MSATVGDLDGRQSDEPNHHPPWHWRLHEPLLGKTRKELVTARRKNVSHQQDVERLELCLAELREQLEKEQEAHKLTKVELDLITSRAFPRITELQDKLTAAEQAAADAQLAAASAEREVQRLKEDGGCRDSGSGASGSHSRDNGSRHPPSQDADGATAQDGNQRVSELTRTLTAERLARAAQLAASSAKQENQHLKEELATRAELEQALHLAEAELAKELQQAREDNASLQQHALRLEMDMMESRVLHEKAIESALQQASVQAELRAEVAFKAMLTEAERAAQAAQVAAARAEQENQQLKEELAARLAEDNAAKRVAEGIAPGARYQRGGLQSLLRSAEVVADEAASPSRSRPESDGVFSFRSRLHSRRAVVPVASTSVLPTPEALCTCCHCARELA